MLEGEVKVGRMMGRMREKGKRKHYDSKIIIIIIIINKSTWQSFCEN